MLYSIVISRTVFQVQFQAQTRKGRGSSGTRLLQITDNVPFPHNFLTSFLCNTDNKHDLGLYLASKIVSIHSHVGNTHLLLCATHNNSVISFPSTLMIHCFKFQVQLKKLIKKLFDMLFIVSKLDTLLEIQLIETDVLILLLAYIAIKLISNNDSFNLYLKLVTPNPTWYNILSLIEHLTIDVCKALPYFYAFTGCVTVPNFNGKGKCTFF